MKPQGERWDPVDEQFQSDVGEETLKPPMSPYQRDPYRLPREAGILHVVPSTFGLTG